MSKAATSWTPRQDSPAPAALATWLTTQCAQYDILQPGQQDLLARIGLTMETARGAAARPAEREADFAVGLGYARSYHATHRTLAAAIDTVHDGFQLGRWLRRQRQHARTDADRGTPPTAAAKALNRIDPWWCPPWSLAWQRAWQHIHDQIKAGHRLDTDHHFRSFAPPNAPGSASSAPTTTTSTPTSSASWPTSASPTRARTRPSTPTQKPHSRMPAPTPPPTTPWPWPTPPFTTASLWGAG